MLSRIALFTSALVLACGLGFAEDAKEEKTIKLVHVESGKAVAPDGSEDDATKIVVVKDEAKPAQEWVVVKDGDFVKIVHKSCKKVLDVEGVSGDEGASIIWVDATTALVAIESPRARFYFTYYRRMAQVGITLAPGDVMLFTNENVAKASLINLDTPFEDLELREIVPPSARGLRALGESGTENEAVGLWELRRK